MTKMTDQAVSWVTLARIVEWMDNYLDEGVSGAYKEQPLAQDWARVTKLAEEVGEAVDALIGITGQNPRKGEYGSQEDLLSELADVALTGIYAMQHFHKDIDVTMERLLARARHHCDRVITERTTDTLTDILDGVDKEDNEEQQLLDIVHQSPPEGEFYLPCCNRSALEMPRWHNRLTNDPALVTCKGG